MVFKTKKKKKIAERAAHAEQMLDEKAPKKAHMFMKRPVRRRSVSLRRGENQRGEGPGVLLTVKIWGAAGQGIGVAKKLKCLPTHWKENLKKAKSRVNKRENFEEGGAWTQNQRARQEGEMRARQKEGKND